MTREETVAALVAERWGPPVKEAHCWTGRAPVADLLDLLKLDPDAPELVDVREAVNQW